MDAVAAPSAKQKLGRPLIPPNYVSLRHLQELRLKEEEQRQREEEAAARVKEEQRRREEEEAAARRRAVEEQRRREEEEAAARRRAVEEQRRREEEEAAARRVKEAAAAAPMKPSSSSNTFFGYKERSRGGQRSVVVAHRRPPPSRGEGTAMKSDGATGGCHGQKGPDGDAANAPLGTGRKAKNEGKEKDKVLATTSGGSGEPTGEATALLYRGKPQDKRKVEASGYQGTASGVSNAPGELAEAGIGSHRGSGRQKNKRKGKKGLDGRSTEIASSSMMGKQDSSPPRGVNSENIEKGLGETRTGTTSSGAPDVSPPSGVKSEKIGKNKPLEGMCTDTVPSSNMQYRKTAQTRLTGRSNRRSSGGQGFMWEAKSEGLGEKQTVVEVSAQPQTSAEGCNNRRTEVKSESSGKKQLAVKVVAQPCPDTEDSSSRRRDNGQGTIREAKSDGLDEKQPVVEVRATAQRKLWHARHSHERRPGGGSGVAGEHGGVWVPKATAARDSADVRKFP